MTGRLVVAIWLDSKARMTRKINLKLVLVKNLGLGKSLELLLLYHV